MPKAEMSQEALVELFLKKAAEPAPEANVILARHLQSRESCDLARAVSEAIGRYVATDTPWLPTPPELLPPLG